MERVVASVQLTIDGHELNAEAGQTILEAARAADIYIPSLCAHPTLATVSELKGTDHVFRGGERIESDNPDATWDGCGLCAVTVDGSDDLVRACQTEVAAGMSVITMSEPIVTHRRARLAEILAEHPHSCLTCAQSEGCSLTQCSSNVPEDERCCLLFGSCELQQVSQFIGVPADLPKYKPRGLPKITGEPLYDWNTELCIGCLRCVRACRDFRDVGTLSFVIKDRRPVVGTTIAPSRLESYCRFCGSCVEVCPTGALVDKTRIAKDEREQALVPCRNACPAGVDIPRFVRYLASGDSQSAIAVIREKLPFSFAPSYICFHPCENECRRGTINNPIAICQLKRFAADHDDGGWRARQKRLPSTGKTVAVIGSGPAGLTAAFYLAKQGHAVTIHEALSEPGGMLRVGIPQYRYPRDLLERDIDEIKAVGVTIKTGAPIQNGVALEKLAKTNDAVFIATGAHEPKRITIEGTDLHGVHWGTEFLRACALGECTPEEIAGLDVMVIGGGNVAVDAARTALRLGAENVHVISLENDDELPAYDWEIKEAKEEGIGFLHRWGPKEILGKGGRVTGLRLKRCTRVFDEHGAFNPAYDDDEMRQLITDAVILAIGQDPSSAPFDGCGLNANRTITADPDTFRTNMERVFAGGDVVSGPASVIEAIAVGRKAASEIDKSLGGDGDIDESLLDDAPLIEQLGRIEDFGKLDRATMPAPGPTERARSFMIIEDGFTEEGARYEARRCLACNLRLLIDQSVLPPRENGASELTAETVEALPEREGVYQLLDADKKVVAIKGVANLRDALSEVVDDAGQARYFVYEEETMYTKRESELIQQYLQEHGELPGGGEDELDDLF
jgi:formate dehydrogenase beta subunit